MMMQEGVGKRHVSSGCERLDAFDEDTVRLIAANIRSPRESLGDFRALVAANQLATGRLDEWKTLSGILRFLGGRAWSSGRLGLVPKVDCRT
jgi:N-methylhydantoinase B/oxoprolinase/acetone carboxylase alpha subunit